MVVVVISSKMLYNGDDSEVDNRTMRSTCEYLLPPPSLDFECHPQAVALSGRRERGKNGLSNKQ